MLRLRACSRALRVLNLLPMDHERSPYRRPAAPPATTSAAPAELGALVRRYVGRRQPVVLPLAAAIAGALVSVAATSSHEPRTLGVAIAGGVAAVLFAVGLLARRVLRRTEIAEHEEGIVVTRGRRTDRVRFDEVDRLCVGMVSTQRLFGVALLTGPVVRITTHDGRHVVLRNGEVEDFSSLVDRLERQCSGPLVGDARDALEAGESLDFGPLVFDRDEVRAGAAKAPWRQIEGATIHLDRIELARDGRVWRTVRFEHLAHRRVVLALLPRLTRVRRGPHAEIG